MVRPIGPYTLGPQFWLRTETGADARLAGGARGGALMAWMRFPALASYLATTPAARAGLLPDRLWTSSRAYKR